MCGNPNYLQAFIQPVIFFVCRQCAPVATFVECDHLRAHHRVHHNVRQLPTSKVRLYKAFPGAYNQALRSFRRGQWSTRIPPLTVVQTVAHANSPTYYVQPDEKQNAENLVPNVGETNSTRKQVLLYLFPIYHSYYHFLLFIYFRLKTNTVNVGKSQVTSENGNNNNKTNAITSASSEERGKNTDKASVVPTKVISTLYQYAIK